ncbi:hypothetical protein ACS0TY_004708 [Phlomoides rotata]
MSRNYDNWERLVAAVIKKQQIWELCHQHSRSPSICSEASSSDFSTSSSFDLENREEHAQKHPVPKLVFLKGAFRGTKELGKGRFGTSSLTKLRRDMRSDQDFLARGTQLVMKKLHGKVKVTEEEFKTVFGNCRHENVAAPRAYYFSSNGNYIFSDYHSQGSVYDMLRRARGIAHIHSQYGGKLAHGNIRSSNIFLNSQQYGCVSDFGLAAIMRMAGEMGGLDYHASEYEFKNASQESDVYSFGVLLVELATGRSPMVPQGSQKNLHIVAWARSIVSQDSAFNMFDKNLIGRLLCDEVDLPHLVCERRFLVGHPAVTIKEFRASLRSQMEEMWQVARRCLAMLPEDRPKMIEVVLMLENIANLGTTLKTPMGKIMSEIL